MAKLDTRAPVKPPIALLRPSEARPPARSPRHTASAHRRAPWRHPQPPRPRLFLGGGSGRPRRRSQPRRARKVVTQGDGGGRAAAMTGPAAPKRLPRRSLCLPFCTRSHAGTASRHRLSAREGGSPALGRLSEGTMWPKGESSPHPVRLPRPRWARG